MSQSFGYLINRIYPDGLADATYRQEKANTFLALVKKDPDNHGYGFDVNVQTVLGSARSADFTSAMGTDNTFGGGVRFRLDFKDDFAQFYVDAKEWEAAGPMGDRGDLLQRSMDNAMQNLRNSVAMGLASDGSGALAKITNINTTTAPYYFEVANSRDLALVDYGKVLESSATRVGGTKRTGQAVVTRVTGTTNIVGGSPAVGRVYYTTSTGWAPVVNDWIYFRGDKDAKIQGVLAWIPTADPQPGDSFGGVDRSIAPRQLAGLRVDASGQTDPEDALSLGMEPFRQYKITPTHVFMNPYDYAKLESVLQDKKRIVDVPNNYEIGIKGIEWANGAVLVQDPNFPRGYAFPLTLSTWTLRSMKDVPHLVNEDGLKAQRADTADGFAGRMRAWANLQCTDPSQNGVITLPVY